MVHNSCQDTGGCEHEGLEASKLSTLLTSCAVSTDDSGTPESLQQVLSSHKSACEMDDGISMLARLGASRLPIATGGLRLGLPTTTSALPVAWPGTLLRSPCSAGPPSRSAAPAWVRVGSRSLAEVFCWQHTVALWSEPEPDACIIVRTMTVVSTGSGFAG